MYLEMDDFLWLKHRKCGKKVGMGNTTITSEAKFLNQLISTHADSAHANLNFIFLCVMETCTEYCTKYVQMFAGLAVLDPERAAV